MDNQPLILSLETATRGGSVFLCHGREELAARRGDPEVSQSSSLLADISAALAEAGVSLRNINLFACASGPGSFTGLRIGIATLKALAVSLNQPCVGIPTLQAVAHAAGASRATVALLPAGRGEVFAQLFSVGHDEIVTALDQPAHLSPQRMLERYSALANLTWAGSGAHQQQNIVRDFARQNGIVFVEAGDSALTDRTSGDAVWKLARPETNLARQVARLALQLYVAGQVESPETLSAIYVRPSDAELNQKLCR